MADGYDKCISGGLLVRVKGGSVAMEFAWFCGGVWVNYLHIGRYLGGFHDEICFCTGFGVGFYDGKS